MERINNIEDIPSNRKKKVVIADDIAVQGISGRNFGSKEAKDFLAYMTIISHKNTSVIMTIQSLRILDIYGVMSSQNVNLMLKYSEGWNMALERDGWISDLIKTNNDYLGYILEKTIGKNYSSGIHISKGLTYDVKENVVGYNYLPQFWCDEISKVWQ